MTPEQERLVRASALASGSLLALKSIGYLVGAFVLAAILTAAWFISAGIIALLVKTAHMIGWL